MNTDHQISRENILEQLLQTTQEGFWFIDNDAVTFDVNPAMCDLLGRARDEIIGRPIYDFVDKENADVFRRQIAARAQGESSPYEIALQRPDGTNVPCINNASPILNDQGEKIASIGLWTDISGIKSTQNELAQARDEMERRIEEQTRQLRESEQRFRGIIEHTPASIILKDLDGRFRLVNSDFARRYGVEPADLEGKTDHDIHPRHVADRYAEQDREVLLTKKIIHEEMLVPFMSGTDHWVSITKFPVEDDQGIPIGIASISVDITEQRLVEESLRQAQKMEAVGQLTGGVAHDINNLLMVIQGSAELIDIDTGRDNTIKKEKILKAVKRGGELTARLLAFSRRQPLNPETVDLAALVTSMSSLLARTLEETIEVITQAEGDLWMAAADPGQVENAILNLALNARDAMPGGGRLTIECANRLIDEEEARVDAGLKPGEYITMSVADEGTGMSEDVMTHAFEPFFTTKEVGKGSGLGLSMVYGFAKQSNGYVKIDSELGRGTTVTLYLPRTQSNLTQVRKSEEVRTPLGQDKTILIIEDDPEVQELAAEMVVSLNYQVITADTAAQARELLVNGHGIDLVLSDVILPGGTSGPEFAKAASLQDPSLRFVFMSGYPAQVPKGQGLLDADDILIRKPFKRDELAAALNAAMQ